MKFMTLVGLMTLLLGPAVSWGQDQKGENRKERRQKMIQRFDKDGDGKLNDEERAAAKAEIKQKRQERRQEILKKFDTDGDGKLNDAERAAAKEEFKKRRGEGKAGRAGRKHRRCPDGEKS